MTILVKSLLKNYMRDWESVFWTLIFPLIFLFLFKFSEDIFENVELFVNFPSNFSYFDLVVPGIIGFGIAQSHTTTVAINITTFKEKNILKRIAATPIPIWKFFFGQLVMHLLVAFLQISLIIVTSTIFLDSNFELSLIGLTYFYGLLGSVVFINIGFLCGTMTQTPKAANGVASAIIFSMLFISGIFFSTELLPETISTISRFLPLTAIVDLLRATWVADLGATEFWERIILLFAWIFITASLSIKNFRFKDI